MGDVSGRSAPTPPQAIASILLLLTMRAPTSCTRPDSTHYSSLVRSCQRTASLHLPFGRTYTFDPGTALVSDVRGPTVLGLL
ncbi:hypothetical protein CALCODRAFT_499550 [Calocera cornea HHB12733]|uniref:Secreted protein n=1 Tax=Calocera cornea HHB12733 TaxID=1353952 RepID=A0A165EDC7_9BASI|nr:hypothetical protein CALCODRAFT_499550 [Calocera cornea HHB12733]